jgi:hypothetical protein
MFKNTTITITNNTIEIESNNRFALFFLTMLALVGQAYQIMDAHIYRVISSAEFKAFKLGATYLLFALAGAVVGVNVYLIWLLS